LAFFGDSKKKITHVGVLLSTSEIIHAYGKIRIDKINDKGIINSETKKKTHKLIEIRTY
jgi:cell wall-associated NlpC family hydrolase